MTDNKSYGAKQAVQTMLFYYLSSLITTVEDPKQYIASELGSMIDLSEEQIQYVKLSLATEDKVLSNFESCIQLLDAMKDKDSVDLESIKIVKDVLILMKDACKKTLEDFEVGNEVYND
jgi:hypothetical protein